MSNTVYDRPIWFPLFIMWHYSFCFRFYICKTLQIRRLILVCKKLSIVLQSIVKISHSLFGIPSDGLNSPKV